VTTVLALDQGTTSTRAIAFGPGGRRLVHSVEHRQIYPRPGWVEHDPEELIASLRACLDRAGGDVAAVGLANQGESCLAWDAQTGRALSPVIVWQDARTADRTAALRTAGAEALSLARAGLPLDPYFSASKLGWIIDHIPEARALHAAGRLRLGTTDAFFRERLTGHCATDVTTASRTGLMDLVTGAWDAELCTLHGVPRYALPPILPTTGDFGTVPAGGRPVPLTASATDQQAALYGHGCRRAGDLKITFGTGAFALAVTGPALPPAGRGPLPTVAWRKAGEPPTHALDGGVYAASAAVNWARDLGLFTDLAAISDFAARPAIDRGLAFVPALGGLACPHWDRAARGAWFGLGLDTGPRDMVQALLEGIALRTAEVVDAIAALQPLNGPVSIDGGMTANGYFCRFLADTLGRAIRVSDEPELTALGIALLAAEAAGLPLDAAPAGRLIPPGPATPARRETFARALAALRTFHG
jgi:glycerol kinase